jgi:hypothetical protein
MKLSKKIIYFTVAIAVILVAGIYFFTNIEVSYTAFNSYQDVISDPERLKAGWLPAWLPKSASHIEESHDIDTNQSWLTFNFSQSDDFYTSACTRISKKEAKLPYNRNIKRFPKFVSIMNDQLHNNTSLIFYICEGIGPRHLAIDLQLSAAYAWSLPH